MMKPRNYDRTPSYGEYIILPAGSYVLRIREVKEGSDLRRQQIIDVFYDIAEGLYSNHYTKQWQNDTRENKKWNGNCRIWVLDRDGNTSMKFKSFCEAVEKSNAGFKILWGSGFGSCFKNKLVGGVFRREEYRKNDGSVGMVTRCMRFVTAKAIRNERFTIPEDKKLTNDTASYPSFTQESEAVTGYNTDFDEDDLPF